MKVTETKITGLFIIEPDCFGDHRGWFMETYSTEKYAQIGINNIFVQDNHSMSAKKGTLRGLHFQNDPMAQAKLVRCTKGAVLDVAVDIRKGSPTYCQWVSVELSEENKRQFFIPKGFAHGFVALSEEVELLYKASGEYAPQADRGIFWKDKVEIFCIDENKHHLFPDSLSHFVTDENYRKKVRKEIPYFYLQHNKKDYQFHLKKGSLEKHRANFLKESLTYEELFDLFSAKK